jgi:hypothetical protein
LALGLHYDLIAVDVWRVYAGGAFGLTRFSHRSSAGIENGPATSASAVRFAPSAELRAGVSLYGVFLELLARLAPASGTDASSGASFDVNPLRAGLVLGYRLGVL